MHQHGTEHEQGPNLVPPPRAITIALRLSGARGSELEHSSTWAKEASPATIEIRAPASVGR